MNVNWWMLKWIMFVMVCHDHDVMTSLRHVIQFNVTRQTISEDTGETIITFFGRKKNIWRYFSGKIKKIFVKFQNNQLEWTSSIQVWVQRQN